MPNFLKMLKFHKFRKIAENSSKFIGFWKKVEKLETLKKNSEIEFLQFKFVHPRREWTTSGEGQWRSVYLSHTIRPYVFPLAPMSTVGAMISSPDVISKLPFLLFIKSLLYRYTRRWYLGNREKANEWIEMEAKSTYSLMETATPFSELYMKN